MSYNWILQSPVHSPSGRYVASMDYNPNTGKTVLFGGATGFSGSVANNETWAWDGTDWTQVFPTGAPSARSWHKLVYFPPTDEFIMFGGMNNAGGLLSETWALSGNLATWTQKTPVTNPVARIEHMMAYHPGTTSIIMLGGNAGFGDRYDTYRWTGTNWVLLSPANAPFAPTGGNVRFYSTSGRGFGLDPTSGKLVLTHQQWQFAPPSLSVLAVQAYFDGNDYTDIASIGAVMFGTFQFGAAPTAAVHSNIGKLLLAGGDGGSPGEATSTLQAFPSHTWDQGYITPLTSDPVAKVQYPSLAPDLNGDVVSLARDPFGTQNTYVFKLVPAFKGQIYRRS